MSNGMGSGGFDNSQYAQQAAVEQKIRPGGVWYFLAVVFLLAGLGGGGVMVYQFVTGFVEITSSMEHFRAPGEFEAAFDKPGTYAIYLVGDHPRPEPENLTVTVTHKGGGEIALAEVYSSGSMTVNDESFKQLYKFQLDQPATVVVRTQTGKDPEATLPLPAGGKQVGINSGYAPRLAVGPEFMVSDIFKLIGKIFLGIGLAAVGFIAALVIFIVTIIKRGNCKRRLASLR
ncbi:MAG: hypothetical protein K8S55_15010 [Phycisphaerae bacterium]|nr:hypothetical protein [Phycisphaerae bacterium]